jgi:hypothetical protein
MFKVTSKEQIIFKSVLFKQTPIMVKLKGI